MINLIDRAIEQFLREQVPLPEASIGLAFEAPDSEWGAALNRPTVNVFLWDICRAGAGVATTGLPEQRTANGQTERRPASPVIDFHYLITGWASDMRDEHQLLGLVLRAVLTNPKLPDGYLPEGVASGKCTLSLAGADEPTRGDFWSALGGKLKPALKLRVSVPMDVFSWRAAGEPVRSIEVAPQVMPRSSAVATRPGVAGGTSGEIGVRRRRNGALLMEGHQPAPAHPDPADPGS